MWAFTRRVPADCGSTCETTVVLCMIIIVPAKLGIHSSLSARQWSIFLKSWQSSERPKKIMPTVIVRQLKILLEYVSQPLSCIRICEFALFYFQMKRNKLDLPFRRNQGIPVGYTSLHYKNGFKISLKPWNNVMLCFMLFTTKSRLARSPFCRNWFFFL